MQGMGKVALFVFMHPDTLTAVASGNVWGIAILIDYIALFVTSVVGLAVIIERYVRLRASRLMMDSLRAVPEQIAAGDVDGAVRVCRESRTVFGAALAPELKEVQAGHVTIEEAAEETGEVASDKLNANLDLLKTVATVGPLLGLLGTVLGMMFAFGQVEMISRKETLAQGIVSALDTTVRGLVIAIACLAVERHLMRKIDHASRAFGTLLTAVVRNFRRQSARQED